MVYSGKKALEGALEGRLIRCISAKNGTLKVYQDAIDEAVEGV
jgi:hypothetical protein